MDNVEPLKSINQKVYRIKVHSILRFIIVSIGILLSLIMLMNKYIPWPEEKLFGFLQMTVVFLGSIYLAHVICLEKGKVILKKEGIMHTWERRFFLNWEKDFLIPWALVDNYVFEEDRTFDSFIINLSNNTRYRVNRINILPIKDDFYKLVRDFPKVSNEMKSELTSVEGGHSIKRGKSIYETKGFRLIFRFMVIAYLFMLYNALSNQDAHVSWGALGVIGFSLLFYSTLLKGRKKED